jgi:hypothetical protein
MQYMLLIYMPEPAPGDGELAMPDMAPWFAYTDWLREKGIYKAGDPLAPSSATTTIRVRDGQRLTTDGPFAETKEVLGGYYVIETDDFDLALEAAARCPGALYGSMEVRPIFEM